MASTETRLSYSHSTNKNPLKLGKDGSERLAIPKSPTIDSVSHYHNPLEDDASRSYRTGLGNVSYFPDHVARVSYIASVVKPDANGNYLKDLQGGMDLLATRLAPSYFPGTIVQHVTTQVDGYFPAACPSKNFSNCQDVTASIGLYLRAIPMAGEGSSSNESGSYNSLGENKEANMLVDPSMMTEELLAFQESLNTAIANDELQEAIRQEYRRKQDDDIIPAVVIVTDTIDKVGVGANTGINSEKNFTSVITDDSINSDNDSIENDDNNATDSGDFFDVSSGNFSSGTTIDITLGEPSISTSSVVSAGGVGDLKNVGLAVGGVIGTVLISVLLASFISVARRHGDSRRGGATTVKAPKKIKKNHSSCHSYTKNNDDTDVYEQSGLKVRGGAYFVDNAIDLGDEEEGFTGRTMRTFNSESTDFTSSHEVQVQAVPTSSSSNSLGKNTHLPQTTRSDMNNSSQVYETNMLLQTGKTHWKRKTVENLIEKAVASSGDLGSSDNDDHNYSRTIHNEACADAYNGKYDDDEDDENESDYVFGEGDDSESSVEQHLLSASKSSEFRSVPFGQLTRLQNSNTHNLDSRASPQLAMSSIRANDIYSQTGKETNVMEKTCSSCTGDVSDSPQKSSSQCPLKVSSSTRGSCSVERIEDSSPPSELDVAITNCDWTTVGAKAAVPASTCASVNQPPISRRVKLQHSFPSHRLSDFSQKADELDRLVETGDWQALAVTTAKYDAEGGVCEGGATDEDAGRSFTSRTSTQGSEANDSCASIMDNSSEGRSTSMGRSVTTSASQKQRIQEVRAQVIQLVLEVVPDEEGNVNEMMIQFKGREEDLLETLRTMKERKVARKARIESQKIARRNTRPRDTTEGFHPATPGITTNDDSDLQQPQKKYADVHDESSANTSKNIDDADEQNVNKNFSSIEKVGSFENATRVNPEEAAAAAAAWAIQRSFDVMMEKEGKVNP